MSKEKKKSVFKRLLKWSFISFILLLGAVIVLPYLFKDEIIDFIENEVEKTLNAKLELGEVELSFLSTFPNFTLETSNTHLIGVEQFEGVQLFGSKQLEVTLDLNSVLFGDTYEVKQIHLIEPEINVVVTKTGNANYDIVKLDTNAAEGKEDSTEGAPFKLALQDYQIENANISYVDSSMDFGIVLEEFYHSGQGDFTLDELILQTKTTSSKVSLQYDGITYLREVVADIDCALKMNLTTMRFEFDENNVQLNDLVLGFSGWFEMAEDFYDMDIELASKDTKFKQLLSMVPGIYSPDFGAIKTDGTIGFSARIFDKYSEKSIPGFDVNLDVNNAFFKYPELPGRVSNIDVHTNLQRAPGEDLDNLVINMEKAHAEWADNFIDAKLRLSQPVSDPKFSSAVNSFIDFASIQQVIPMEDDESYSGVLETNILVSGLMSDVLEERYTEVNASGKASLSQMIIKTMAVPYSVEVNDAVLLFNPQNISLVQLDAKLGQSDLTARGTFTNYLSYVFNEEALAGEFAVNSTFMNLDELMALPVDEEDEEVQVVETEITEAAEAAPFALPININFTLSSNIDELKYDGITIEEVRGNVVLANGIATLEGVGMNLLGGSLLMDGIYNTQNPNEPKVSFDFDLKEMDINQRAQYFNTVDKLMPIASKCQGIFSSKMSFNSALDRNYMPIYETIFGDGNFATSTVLVEGFEPLNKLAKAIKVQKLAKQTINDVSCYFKIIDGKVLVEPFDIQLGGIATKIEGSTSFEQDLDYDILMEIPRKELGSQANTLIDGLMSQAAGNGVNLDLSEVIPVKIKMTGTVTDPEISTDFKDQGKQVVADIKGQVTDKINDELENMDAELKAKAEALMSAARMRAEQIKAEAKKQGDAIRNEGKSLANSTRNEGDKQAQNLIKEAKKKGTIAAKLAKPAAEKIRKEANQQASKIEMEAENKAVAVEKEANNKAEKLIAEAQKKADKIRLEKRAGD